MCLLLDVYPYPLTYYLGGCAWWLDWYKPLTLSRAIGAVRLAIVVLLLVLIFAC